MKPIKQLITFILLIICCNTKAQTPARDTFYMLKPDRVFDGEQMHEGWQILVKNNMVLAAGVSMNTPSGTIVITLKGCTVLPGLIEGHSHLFLHPYNETPWNDQVLNESRAERTARAVMHAHATVMAGFTTVRDLGTEGAMYDDVGLKQAINKGVINGPHIIASTRAIVVKGSYGPRFESADIDLPQGAAEVSNTDELLKEIRTQIGKGADVIKLYADYRWGKNGEAMPTFSEAELRAGVEAANSTGRQLVVHSSTAEGMRRSIMAGVSTIEHGDDGTPEVFKLMKEKGIALCPTIAAGDAVEQYHGWKKGIDPEPIRLQEKRKSFKAALDAGVIICMGGDVGVYAHGDNAREMEMMVDYGMKPIDVLRSATSVNADVFGISHIAGRIKAGIPADIIAVYDDPSKDISAVRKIKLVMIGGKIVRQ